MVPKTNNGTRTQAQRVDAVVAAFSKFQQVMRETHGAEVVATIEPEMLGGVLQVRATLRVNIISSETPANG